MSNTWHDRAQKITRKERIMRKIIMTVAVLAALTLIGAPSAAADRQGVWLTGHVQDAGWQLPTNTVAGTTGQSRRLEAIQLVDPVATVRGHVQNIGWQGWTDMGVVGTTGQSLRLEAIQVRGRFAPVWCQAHVQNLGWLPPVRDGEVCGTTGRALRLEAVRLWTE